MYTSKSLLDSITIGRLEFDCVNIVAWLQANGGGYARGQALPIEAVANTAGQVSRVSGGSYGAVYKLTGYPGLILKVCFDPKDGYPEYIRSIAVKRAPAWAPKIFAHGGDECTTGFWCVMPEYVDDDRTCKHGHKPASEALHLTTAAGGYGWGYNTEPRYPANEFVRTHRKDIAQIIDSMIQFGAGSDMHSGNIMLDPTTGHYVITDPVSQWLPDDKEAFRNADF